MFNKEELFMEWAVLQINKRLIREADIDLIPPVSDSQRLKEEEWYNRIRSKRKSLTEA